MTTIGRFMSWIRGEKLVALRAYSTQYGGT